MGNSLLKLENEKSMVFDCALKEAWNESKDWILKIKILAKEIERKIEGREIDAKEGEKRVARSSK